MFNLAPSPFPYLNLYIELVHIRQNLNKDPSLHVILCIGKRTVFLGCNNL